MCILQLRLSSPYYVCLPGWVVNKIPSQQTLIEILNLHCDIIPRKQQSNIFTGLWWSTTNTGNLSLVVKESYYFRRYSRNSHILTIKTSLWPSPSRYQLFVCVFSLSLVFVFKDTLSHDDAPPYQVWLQKVEQFKRYLPDKVQTHGHGDSNIYRPVELDNSCKKFNTTPSPPDKFNVEKRPKPKITLIIAYKRSNVAIRKQNSKRLRQRMESGGKVGVGGGGRWGGGITMTAMTNSTNRKPTAQHAAGKQRL